MARRLRLHFVFPARRLLGALMAAACLVSHSAAGPAVGTTGAAAAPAATSFYRNLHDLQLADQHGHALRWRALQGRLLLVNFIYTQCASACSLQTRALAEARAALPRRLRDQVQFLSVSLDPLSDTPAVLRTFAARHGAEQPGWHFATGRPQDIPRLIERLRLLDPRSAQPDLADHSTGLWLIDAQGELRQRYRGLPLDASRLARDLHTLAQLPDAHDPHQP